MRRRNASDGGNLSSFNMNDMRVKLRYYGEVRIIPIQRPLMLDRLQKKVETIFNSEGLLINYDNGEVTVPVQNQADLDKIIALIDQNPHSNFLRLTINQKTLIASGDASLFYFPGEDFGKLGGETNPATNGPAFHIGPTEMSRPLYFKSRSFDQEEFSSSSEDDFPPTRSKSFRHRRGPSPPPGHHISNPSTMNNHNISHRSDPPKGGRFIPEPPEPDGDGFIPNDPPEYPIDPPEYPMTEEDDQRLRSFDSGQFGSSSPVSNGWMSIGSVIYSDLYRRPRGSLSIRKRPSSDVFPDKSDYPEDDYFYKNNRPYSDWNIRDTGFDFFPWQLESFNNSNFSGRSLSPGASSIISQGSSGLVPDYDGSRDISDTFNNLSLKDIHFANKKWTKIRRIGSGAFGTVFLCRDLTTGKEMAMKCVETGSVSPAAMEEVDILHREINLYKKLNHHRIVSYYGSIQEAKSLSIFMEYMEGGSLHDRISRHGALVESEVRRCCRQILEGLDYLHNKRIIHRDVKGANILLDKNDNCKLADFGSSRQIKTIRSKAGCKSVHGTPYWMSPEVISGQGYRYKTDIWSLGCTAVELLTTKPPWFHLEPVAALFKIATQPTKPQLQGSSSLCISFVELCLEKDSNARPSALDLLHHQFLVDR